KAIQEGARAYLNRQFRTLALFVVVVLALLFLLPGEGGIKVGRAVAFVLGAGFSAAIGYLGMWLAVRANLRVATAARRPDGRRGGARAGFRRGAVGGMPVAGESRPGAGGAADIADAHARAALEGSGCGAALLAP